GRRRTSSRCHRCKDDPAEIEARVRGSVAPPGSALRPLPTPCGSVPGLVTSHRFNNQIGRSSIHPVLRSSASYRREQTSARDGATARRQSQGGHMYVRTICAMLVCIALGGCATGGMKFTEMRTAGPKLQGGYARIYFYRSGIPVGVAVQPSI